MHATHPKWKYHATEPAVIVPDVDAEVALGDGWVDHPDFVVVPDQVEPIVPEPIEPIVPEPKPKRK